MIRIFFLYILLAAQFCAAQAVQKRILLPNSNAAYGVDIVETKANEFVIIGSSIDSIGSTLKQTLKLAGVDQNGNLLWHKTYYHPSILYSKVIYSHNMIIRERGHLYSLISTAHQGTVGAAIFKYDYQGDTIFTRQITTYDSSELYLTGIAPMYNDFLVTGAVQTNTPGFNGHPVVGAYLARLDSNGNKLWEKRYYKTNLDHIKQGVEVLFDPANKRIVVVGSQNTNTQGSSMVMITDSAGNLLHDKAVFGGALNEIIKLSDGDYAACGVASAAPVINGNPTFYSVFTKFNDKAELLKGAIYDTAAYENHAARMAELPSGNIVIGGHLDVLYRPGFGGLNNLLRLLFVNKEGKLQYKKYYDNYTDSTNVDRLTGMWLTNDNHIVFTTFNQVPEKPPVQFTFYRVDTNTCDNIAVGCYDLRTVGISEQLFEQNFKVFPNPASQVLYIRSSRGVNFSTQIYSLTGQLLLEEAAAQDEQEIAVTHLVPGVYYLKVTAEQQSFMRKIVIGH